MESSLSAVPDHIPSEFASDTENSAHSRNRKYIPAFRTPEYSTVGEAESEAGPEEEYQRLDHQVRVKRRSVSPPHPSKGYSRLSHQNAPALPQRNCRSRSRSQSPAPDHAPSEEYGRLDHGVGRGPPVVAGDDEYGRLDHGVGGGANLVPGEGEYGKLDHSSESGLVSDLEEGYSKLGVPSPTPQKKPVVPPPYKARPGSPMPDLIRKLNNDQQSVQELPPEVEVYSEVAPSIPNPGVSEGYGRLNYLHPPPPPPGPTSSAEHHEYSRLGATPNAPPTIDPYASLSDAHIQDLTEALMKEGEEGGDYSRLGVVAPPGSAHQVDSLGYSKPWTSYTETLNSTPQPSLDGQRDAVGEPEFEALYDKMEGSEDTPPPPPPRRGSLSRPSKSPPAPPTRPGKPPVPPPPRTQRDTTS